jgi:nucleoid-associated protein YgaU
MIFFAFTIATAQEQGMTKEEWQKQMTELTTKRDALQKQLDALNADIANLNAHSKKLDEDIAAAEDKLFQMYGMTRAEVEAFASELAKHEMRVQELMRMSDEELMKYSEEILGLKKRVDEMATLKVAQLPRFAGRLSTLQSNIASLMRSSQPISDEKTYIVGTWAKNRDCLWNIAKKPDIYANAWLWPKIWQGNREQIKNPDVIHPKQKLKIPQGNTLTQEEKSAAAKYYRKKNKNL